MADEAPPTEMDLTEFRELGYLQEVNRQLLHPLGLALFAQVDDEDGTVASIGVYDNRADPEGWRYAQPPDPAPGGDLASFKSRAATVEREWEDRRGPREARLGYMVQPLSDDAFAPDA